MNEKEYKKLLNDYYATDKLHDDDVPNEEKIEISKRGRIARQKLKKYMYSQLPEYFEVKIKQKKYEAYVKMHKSKYDLDSLFYDYANGGYGNIDSYVKRVITEGKNKIKEFIKNFE